MAAETLEPDTVPPNVVVDGIPAEEQAQYIGPGATRYISRFIEMDRRDSKASWNWGAALFGPLWCFYRKMYSVGLLYLLLMLVVAVICTSGDFADYLRGMLSIMTQSQDYKAVLEYMTENAPTASMWQETLTYIFRVGASILLGLFGNHLYRNKVKRSILQIRTQASDMDTYLYLLAKKGRVSIVLPILAAILYTYIQSFVMIGFAMLLGK